MPDGWPTPQTMGDWMRQQEKRQMHAERRPVPRRASDLLGPGIGPNTTQILDWNTDATAFNGLYYSEPGAINGPDSTRYWLGLVLATADGYGIQRAWEYRNSDNIFPTARQFERTYVPTGGVRLFTPWTSDREDMRHVDTAGQPAFENGWVNYGASSTGVVFRHEGDTVRLAGACKNPSASVTTTIFTLPVGYRPLFYEQDFTNTLRVEPTGAVHLVNGVGANVYVSLTGMTFLARQ